MLNVHKVSWHVAASLDHAPCVDKLLPSHFISGKSLGLIFFSLQETVKTTASFACPNVLQCLIRQGDNFLIWEAGVLCKPVLHPLLV